MIDYNIFDVYTDRVAPFTTAVEIQWATLHMEVDTGAALSLISETTYSQQWPPTHAPKLEKSLVMLRTYTGEELKLLGQADIKVQYGNQAADLHLLVVEGNGPSLLGRDWLRKLQLNWREIHLLHVTKTSLEEVLAAHNGLFE